MKDQSNKVVFLDWGGVITDDPGKDFFSGFLKKNGVTEERIHKLFNGHIMNALRGKLTVAEIVDIVNKEHNLSLDNSFRENFKNWSGIDANPLMLDLVEDLRQSGIRVIALTNMIDITHEEISKRGYFNYFDDVVASCRVGYAKPDKEIYEIALKTAGVKPEDAIFVDDAQRNLDIAEKMGIGTILAENCEQIIRDIKLSLCMS